MKLINLKRERYKTEQVGRFLDDFLHPPKGLRSLTDYRTEIVYVGFYPDVAWYSGTFRQLIPSVKWRIQKYSIS